MLDGWKLVFASAPGTSHKLTNEACQDFACCDSFAGQDGPILVAVCADGAGSAAQAQAGARLACSAFIRAASKAMSEKAGSFAISEQLVNDWIQETRLRVSFEACSNNRDLGDYACTMLTAVVDTECAIFSQIGDGAIVFENDGNYETAFWPQNGEYVNTTFFLTDDDFRNRLQIRSIGSAISELALFTDGLQFLALHNATRTVHAPFFEPMFKSLRESDSPDELGSSLCGFLDSEPVNDRTHDDKTLILASRRSA